MDERASENNMVTGRELERIENRTLDFRFRTASYIHGQRVRMIPDLRR